MFLKKFPRKLTLQIFPGCLGLIVFIIVFYMNKDAKYGLEVNPFSVVFIIVSMPLLITISAFLTRQTGLVFNGINTKQYASILEFRSNLNFTLENVNKDYRKIVYPEKYSMGFKEKLNNMWNLITKKREKSLVFIEFEKMSYN